MNFLNRLPPLLPHIHLALALLLTLELGLVSYITSATHPTPSSVAFLLFTVLFSLLTLLYLTLVPLYFSRWHHPLASLGAAALSMIFWFAGSIALAASTTPYCGGSSVCGSANAAAAFGFVVWVLWVVVVVVLGRDVLEGRRGAAGGAGVGGGPKPYVAA
ncbi:membrane-associating domain-containing protein [Schizothecium vesticola]|uniref:Membrane-associating domain-containing protein n=1 Tax=Schizothecium vesticola TaxID=314040 RepID=A0AA40F3D7_9PEZI|nr:membrane-associating domain-containing protein [Schizothecium vesticola]